MNTLHPPLPKMRIDLGKKFSLQNLVIFKHFASDLKWQLPTTTYTSNFLSFLKYSLSLQTSNSTKPQTSNLNLQWLPLATLPTIHVLPQLPLISPTLPPPLNSTTNPLLLPLVLLLKLNPPISPKPELKIVLKQSLASLQW